MKTAKSCGDRRIALILENLDPAFSDIRANKFSFQISLVELVF